MGLDIKLTLDIDMDRLAEKKKQAQYALDSQIMTDMTPLMK